MGCLKKIFNFILFIIIVAAFFWFGGYTYLKDKYTAYTTPPREVIISEEKDFGGLEKISADYILSRSINLAGYRKINALYVPKNQKITIVDLNTKNIINENDFAEGKIEKKLEDFSLKVLNAPIVPIQNISVEKIGKIQAGNKLVPYVDFEAEMKFLPFIKIKGTIAVYETKNKDSAVNKIKSKIQNSDNITTKLVAASKSLSEYNDLAVKNFISQLSF